MYVQNCDKIDPSRHVINCLKNRIFSFYFDYLLIISFLLFISYKKKY